MGVGVPLPRSFYTVDGCTLAKNCLGKLLVLETEEGRLSAIITETEAYMGVTDRASHAYGGRFTERNRSMYKMGGFSYVYQIYGLYYCLNLTAAEEGNPEAVLIRSAIPVEGIECMLKNRQKKGRAKRYPCSLPLTRKQQEMLLSGPGRLCTAFGIDKTLDGEDLVAGHLFLEDSGIQVTQIGTFPRIGIDYAGEDRDKPWRYVAEEYSE